VASRAQGDRGGSAEADGGLLTSVLENEPIGVAVLSVPDLVYEYANAVFRSFVDEEVVGRRNDDVFPELAQMAPPVLQELRRTGGPWRSEGGEFHVRRAPGQQVETVHASFEVSPLEVGGAPHLLVTVTESAEHAELRRDLEESRQRLVDILDRVGDAYLAVDSEMRVTYINRQAARQLGLEPEQVLGRGVPEIVGAEFGTSAGPSLSHALKERVETRFEVENAATGKTFDVRAYPTQEGAAVVATDVTERKRVLALEREASERRQDALEAERELRAAADRLSEIQRLVASTLDVDEVLVRVSESAAQVLGVDAVAAGIFEGERYRFLAGHNVPKGVIGAEVDLAASAFLRTARETGEPAVSTDAFDDERLDRSFVRRHGLRSILFVPWRVKGEVAGSLSFFRLQEPGSFTDEQVEIACRIAAAAGLAVANSQLYSLEAARLKFAEALDDVNAVIHSSLDYDEIMQRALEEGTRVLGASAGAVFVGTDSESEARYVYGFPRTLLGRRFEADVFPFSRLMEETKEPIGVGTSDMHTLMNPTIARLFRVRSILAIPLLSRGKLVGGIGIVYRKPHEFDELEIGFARRLGASVSLAIENADLYRRQERVADTLQEALLTLPEHIEGLECGHAYHSAAAAARVGGDFYDLFELGGDVVGVTVGDIAGKGLDAAVLTSLVKNALRAQATERGKRPAEVMEIVNEVLLRGSRPESFATVFFGCLDVGDGRLVYCNAGHTTPAVLGPKGVLRTLPPNGPLIGAFHDGAYDDTETVLGRGETLFVYTDGLIEARRDGELYGEERLFELLDRSPASRPPDVVRRVLDEVVTFAGGELGDDVAILAVRRI
jgi:PAS domain S-box-containing protein